MTYMHPNAVLPAPSVLPLLTPHHAASRVTATQAANALLDDLTEEFDVSEETIGQSKILRTLPADLRTHHWYCNLHHSMFLILLSRADDALLNQKRHLCEHFIDMVTVYWVIHSLMEEEGMAMQITRGITTQEHAAAHAEAHVKVTRWWNANVLVPFKNGTASNLQLRAALGRFFNLVVQHISTMDQQAYGTNSSLVERDISREVAHIAASGLPLSPFMAGSQNLMDTLAPYMRQMMGKSSIAPAAGSPLKPLKLVKSSAPLWNGGKGAFRDLFVRNHGTGRPVQTAA